jgi:hypothetical protein
MQTARNANTAIRSGAYLKGRDSLDSRLVVMTFSIVFGNNVAADDTNQKDISRGGKVQASRLAWAEYPGNFGEKECRCIWSIWYNNIGCNVTV